MFSTYGPFEVAAWTRDGIDDLYSRIKAADPRLETSPGIYIIAAAGGDGRLVPRYVGQTKGFGRRLKNHIDDSRFEEIFRDTGSLSFFLIARVSRLGKLRKTSDKKSIDWLESSLIGSCLPLNPEMLNKALTKFHKDMHVPGYWRSTPDTRNESARKLAEMLEIRK